MTESTNEPRDDAPTVIAIAVLAFIVADIAHEVIGHGAAYLAVGGRSFIMTTTRWIGQGVHVDSSGHLFVGLEHGDLYGRIFSFGGPLGSLVFAGLSWLALRALRRPAMRLRLFLWLTFAFNLFWGVGYLIYSGVTGGGDWAETVRGALPDPVWRLLLVVAGVVFYRLSIRALAGAIPGSPGRLWRLVWISYWAAGIIACVAALFDPRGADQAYKSAALVSFLSAAPLLLIPRLPQRSPLPPEPVTRSLGWILAGLLASASFVGALGPGIPVSL